MCFKYSPILTSLILETITISFIRGESLLKETTAKKTGQGLAVDTLTGVKTLPFVQFSYIYKSTVDI